MWLSNIAICCFVLTLSIVNGEGPTCSQSGLGPKDMMMSPGNMNPKYMWAKSGGKVTVPVVLDPEYSHKERGVIFGGLAEMASKTCVKFHVYKHASEVYDGDYVHITKSRSRGCWSYVGKQGGKQDLSLPRGCINHRTVMHEMMHALGFSHEHVRADRDNYVQILWENIQQGRERNFERKSDSKSDAFGPYDYGSIMHYEKNAFTSNGEDTVRPLQGYVEIGRGKRMSHWDAIKINRLYKCGGGHGHANSIFGYGAHSPSEHHHAPEGPQISGPPVPSGPSGPPDTDHSPLRPFGPSIPSQSFRQNPFLSSLRDPNVVEDSEDYSPHGPVSFYDDYYG